MVAGLILQPRETESIFSRGKESSTLSSLGDEGASGPTLTASASGETDDISEEYEGHFLIHPGNNNNNQQPTMIPFTRRDEEGTPPKPPRYPGHFSFNDVGRRKRHQGQVQVQGQQRVSAPTNPFAPASTNPFEVDSSQDASNEFSNSILEGNTPPRVANNTRAAAAAEARPISPAISTNPFDETSSADYVEASYPPRATHSSKTRQQQVVVEEEEERQQPARSHSWDSDRQFPILEIERIKRKTKKLRNEKVDADDGFDRKPNFASARPPSVLTQPTASVTTHSAADRSSGVNSPRGAAQQHHWVPMTPPPPSPPPLPPSSQPTTRHGHYTVRRNRYFPANDSLAEVLDQPTVQSENTHSTGTGGQRSKTSQEAEKELIQSFKKPGRPREQRQSSRSTSATTRSTAGDNNNNNNNTSTSWAARSTPTRSHASTNATVNLPPPADAPDSVEDELDNNDDDESNNHNNNTRQFRQPLEYRHDNKQALETSRDSTTTTEVSERTPPSPPPSDLILLDLCAEATDADDVAWRNALCLLSNQPHLAAVVDPGAEQFTPLHVCCLGSDAPPSFIILALLYAHPAATRTPDAGGRLPLHLAAASSADITTLQLLVNEYPAAVSHTDHVGMTPLHLYLKRLGKNSTVRSGDALPPFDPECVRILLGQTDSAATSHLDDATTPTTASHILFRRRGHVDLSGPDLTRRVLQRPRPVTRFTRVDHEAAIAQYAPAIQVSLRKCARWHVKQRSTTSPSSSPVQSPSSHYSDRWREEREDEENDDEAVDADDISPAAIAAPVTSELPIHMVIDRVLQQQEQEEIEFTNDTEIDSSPPPLGQKSSSEDEDDEDEDAEFLDHKDAEQPTAARSSKSPLADPMIMDVMRLIIESFPEGLSMKDGDGYTPLLMVLSSAGQELPNLDVVCLLLGRRTPATISDWSVDQELPVHSMPTGASMWLNPAMVPSTWTKQLPLHIVSEEFLSELPLMQAIYEAYPAAIQVQDGHGRTPLHLALSSYRKVAVDPRVMNMLFSESVAQTQDRKGQVPLDMMLENAQVLPDSVPWAWKLAEANDPAIGTVYQRFFHSSLLHLASTSSRGAGRGILHDLQVLPQWMRRQACVSTFVQELLIEEVSTPWKCSLIMLDGILLVGLLIVFRLQMNEYIVTGSYLATWYTYAVYAFAAVRFFFLGAQATLASSLGQYNDTVMMNLWYWVDYAGMILAIVTSILFNGSVQEDMILSLGTAATGFFWWSVVGYISKWSFAMAIFSGMLGQLAQYLVYVLIAFAAVVLAFGQMFYTIFQTNCEDAIASSSVCSVKDSYRVIYLLLRGASLVDETGETPMSTQAITMVASFLFFGLVVAVGLLAVVVLVSGQADVDELARKSYWEPMMAYVMSMNTVGFCGRSKRRTCGDAMSAKLEVAWDALTFHYTGQDATKNKTWFIRPCISWVLAVLSFLLIPVWLVLGLVTLGFLWPPQIRRAIFRPATLWYRRRSVVRASETTSQQLYGLRSETTKFKVLTYDRMTSMEKELRDLKALLSMALHDD